MTRDDYDRIQQMIDATIEHHLDMSDRVVPRGMVFATMDDVDAIPEPRDYDGDIHDLQNGLSRLEEQVNELEDSGE